jgi:DNA polymerase III epsilon subunit-like protein
VAAIDFLHFCLKASESNGGALPVLVAHNAGFDNRMLLSMCWQAGVDVPSEWRALCTYVVADQLKKQRSPAFLQVPNLKLGTLATAFGCAFVCV